jgi:hypothetical protein
MRIPEDSYRCEKGQEGEVGSQCVRVVLNWVLSDMGTLESRAGPLTRGLSLSHIMNVIALGSCLKDSGPLGDLTYCARNSVVDASLDPESSVNSLRGGRIPDDGPGKKAYEGALTVFSASLVAGALNIRCLLLTSSNHTAPVKATTALAIPTTRPAIAPLDSPDGVANGRAVAVDDAEMNILVDADPVCPAMGLVETVVLGIGLMVVLVTIV